MQRNKMVLSKDQRTAARLIFGEKLAAEIVAAAQKQVDDLATTLTGLKAAVDKIDARLTAFEGRNFYHSFFKQNGRESAGTAGYSLASKFYTGGGQRK